MSHELPSRYYSSKLDQFSRVQEAVDYSLKQNLKGKAATIFYNCGDSEPTQALTVDSQVLTMLMGAETALQREIRESAPLQLPNEDVS